MDRKGILNSVMSAAHWISSPWNLVTGFFFFKFHSCILIFQIHDSSHFLFLLVPISVNFIFSTLICLLHLNCQSCWHEMVYDICHIILAPVILMSLLLFLMRKHNLCFLSFFFINLKRDSLILLTSTVHHLLFLLIFLYFCLFSLSFGSTLTFIVSL